MALIQECSAYFVEKVAKLSVALLYFFDTFYEAGIKTNAINKEYRENSH